jgi:hypothetical protein
MGRHHRGHTRGKRFGAAQRRARRVLGDGLFAGALAVVTFLLLWGAIARSPPLDVPDALAFVFGVWAAFVLALAVMALNTGARRRGARRSPR